MPTRLTLCVAVAAAGAAAGGEAHTPEAAEYELKRAGLFAPPAELLKNFGAFTPISAGEARRLVGRLGSRSFRERQAATRKLMAAGPDALPVIKTAAASPDPEIARRARRVMTALKKNRPDRVLAAVTLIARGRPDGAADALLKYLDAAGPLAGDAVAAMAPAVAERGLAVAELKAWLADGQAHRRAAAGRLLAARDDCRDAARGLLKDRDPAVRVPVARALLASGDLAAVPAVVESMRGRYGDAFRAEALLRRLKRDGPPGKALRTGDAADRERVAAYWADWWAARRGDQGGSVMAEPAAPLGRTIIAEIDRTRANRNEGRVWCRGRGGETVWEIAGLNGPFNVRPLPGGLLLVCLYYGERVVVFDRRGRRLWQSMGLGSGPVAAHPVPGGGYLVATLNQVLAIGPSGVRQEVLLTGRGYIYDVWPRPAGGFIYLMDGSVGATGPREGTWRLPGLNSTQWGRLTPRPGNRLLVAGSQGANRVVGYRFDGRSLTAGRLSFEAPKPVSAVPVAGGRLLTCHGSEKFVAEYAVGGGKVDKVWQAKTPGRPFAAVRE